MFHFENSQLHCSTCGSYLIEVICPDCDGRGRKRMLAGERPCSHCQGNGFRRQCVLGHPQEENRRAAQMSASFA